MKHVFLLAVLTLGSPLGAKETPTPAPPVARLAPSDARLTKLEADMARLVNDARHKAKLPPLRLTAALSDIARAHSSEMRDKNYFAHESPTPTLHLPLDRYHRALGHTPVIIAENVFRSWSGPRSKRRAIAPRIVADGHRALMNSPGHRANILYPDLTRVGIGIAVNARGDVWITQVFDRP